MRLYVQSVLIRSASISIMEHSELSYCLFCLSTQYIHTCSLCAECCNCYTCIQCYKNQIQPLCELCSRCPIDCQCVRCYGCNHLYPENKYICSFCNCGKNCCCDNQSYKFHPKSILIKNKVNLARYSKQNTMTNIANPTTRLISGEIELCGFKTPTKASISSFEHTINVWGGSIVRDGSLPDGGFEINTHPAGGDYWCDQVHDIMAQAMLSGAFITNAAGCHIHVDCRDVGYTELARILLVLGCVERVLFMMVPPQRRDNHFCVLWAHHYASNIAHRYSACPNNNERVMMLEYRESILKDLYGFSNKELVSRVKKTKQHDNRYRAVNVHSFIHRGTIELRLPNGTIYADNIINWGILLALLIEYAITHTMRDLYTLTKPALPDNSLNIELVPVAKQMIVLETIITPHGFLKDWVQSRLKWAKNISNNFYEGPIK